MPAFLLGKNLLSNEKARKTDTHNTYKVLQPSVTNILHILDRPLGRSD